MATPAETACTAGPVLLQGLTAAPSLLQARQPRAELAFLLWREPGFLQQDYIEGACKLRKKMETRSCEFVLQYRVVWSGSQGDAHGARLTCV